MLVLGKCVSKAARSEISNGASTQTIRREQAKNLWFKLKSGGGDREAAVSTRRMDGGEKETWAKKAKCVAGAQMRN